MVPLTSPSLTCPRPESLFHPTSTTISQERNQNPERGKIRDSKITITLHSSSQSICIYARPSLTNLRHSRPSQRRFHPSGRATKVVWWFGLIRLSWERRSSLPEQTRSEAPRGAADLKISRMRKMLKSYKALKAMPWSWRIHQIKLKIHQTRGSMA